MEDCEVLVLGGGSAAEALCHEGVGRRPVVMVEQQRFGGICPFLACMPSKAMLLAATELHRRRGPLQRRDFEAYRLACRRRDRVAEGRSDHAHRRQLERLGVRTVRGRGQIVGPGRVRVGRREFAARDVVLATGSRAKLPPIPGLGTIEPWTSDEVLSRDELPARVAILGGGPVGCELAQILARFGSRVTLVEPEGRLLASEDQELGLAVARTLARDGVRLLAGVRVSQIASLPRGRARLLVAGRGRATERVDVDRVVVAAGREPALTGLGLEAWRPGFEAERVVADDRCRIRGEEHLWVIGDASGAPAFTHTANYQGRVVAANLRGEDRRADYRAIPRAVYLDPPVAAVGLTEEQASRQGLRTLIGRAALAETARGELERLVEGQLLLRAEAGSGVLVGAWVAGPAADELIGELALAVRAAVPIDVLKDVVHPFPTLSEAIGVALRNLGR
ncbi:MAG: dihydrolipoyl dehydrogenase family protein [Candidatus Dormibacteria bacterium]